MSSGDIFHTDWYTDPPWDSVSLSWLINYVRNIRSNPVLSKSIAAQTGEFEMVPMPKEVIQHLAESRRVSTSPGAASLQNIQQVSDVLGKFSQALEAGKLEDAATLLSPNYRDANGRDAARLKEDLKKLLANASGLKIVPFSTDNLIVLGDRLLANIQVAWQATVKEGKAAVSKNASSQIELVLEKGPKGGWMISGIRAV